MIKNLVLLLAAIGVVTLFYALVLWLLDKGSEIFGHQSFIGVFFEKTGFWLSHFGFGPIIFPIFVILAFLVLRKWFGKG